ncbi:hypothetical protein BC938DRAFT_482652 [Jimgerdemannia flammicorona]|uniref:DUF7779 domain-containing protein n=1 Tax=Jimgerdemannia flammicorona TaxID=994334 RepID=A0A433QWC2_9FUNG|nr:hypothetical protein BC938DRAFT_482652 [Jimgerdemannia flammicorona]
MDVNVESSETAQTVFGVNPKRNPRFVNRLDIFERLDYAIEANDNKEPKLITLSGLGGMGKSQVALEFCYRNKEHYQYIFWMEADTDKALQSSFYAAAKKLDLPILKNNPADVVACTIEWFQRNSGWLLVFDNADDYSLNSTSNRRLQDEYVPKSGRGVILMTTRLNYYKTVQGNMIVDLDEIKMDDDTALKLLLRQNEDDGNALAIVHILGHLPLALDLAGALMEIERCKPTEFLENYKNNMEIYLDPDIDVQDRIGNNYGKTIFTVWNVSFDRIKDKNPMASRLIQSIAFLYADNIPLALFEHHAQMIFELDKTVPPGILKRAAQMLADFSFVQRITHRDSKQDDPAKDTLTVHRLVQTAILFKMELPEKLEKCKRLLAALSHELKPVDGPSSRIMEAYVPHVRHLIEQIMQFSPWPLDRPDIVQFSQWSQPLVTRPSSLSEENYRNDFTPLHHAVQQDNAEDITNNIIKYKKIANIGDRNNRTPLHLAAQNGNYTVAKLIIERLEADTRVEDEYGQTPLHKAVESESIEIIKLLCSFGARADINRIDKNGLEPLHLAE